MVTRQSHKQTAQVQTEGCRLAGVQRTWEARGRADRAVCRASAALRLLGLDS